MSVKRILILTNRVPYPLNDGGNLAMDAMIEGYRNAGWQVYLLSMNAARHYIDAATLAQLYTNIYKFETVDVDNSVTPFRVLKNYFFSTMPSHAERFENAAFGTRVKEVACSFKPDVVQVESVFLTGYLSLTGDATTILRMHNIEYQVWQRLAETSTGFIKKHYLKSLAARIKKYEHWAWQQYDRLLPITEVDASIVKQVLPNARMLTIPFGIDTAGIEPDRAASWTAYHIGAMDWLPNQEAVSWFLNDVWPAVHGSNPQMEFVYAGRNMPDSFRKRTIPGATCAGEVPDANAFIADKKILVVPLRSAGGIRVKILEAMAAGKLVISTAIGMQGIDAIPGTHYLLANTRQEFLDAFNSISGDHKQAQSIAENAAVLIKVSYSRPAMMQRLLEWLCR